MTTRQVSLMSPAVVLCTGDVGDVVVVGSKRSATRVVMNSMDLRHAPQRRGHRLRAVSSGSENNEELGGCTMGGNK